MHQFDFCVVQWGLEKGDDTSCFLDTEPRDYDGYVLPPKD
jgi:hypothetical protein